MHITIGADHAGFRLKGRIAALLTELGHTYHDLGAYELDPDDDYTDFGMAVGEAVAKGEAERGIVVCGNGVGACITANKLPGVRAALCHDTLSARQSVEHDDANVLCLGERVIGPDLGLEIVRVWLAARFTGLERYQRRLDKLAALEARVQGQDADRD
jgi:ribose 5-phosphate isomerase B